MRTNEEISLLDYRQYLVDELELAKRADCVNLFYVKYLTNQINLVNIKLIESRKARLFGEA